eukprot:3817760-Amphidinium_carterae.1
MGKNCRSMCSHRQKEFLVRHRLLDHLEFWQALLIHKCYFDRSTLIKYTWGDTFLQRSDAKLD